MSSVRVTLSTLSGRRRCHWVLPGSYTFEELRGFVKGKLRIPKQRQSFVVKDTVVNWNKKLDYYGENHIHVTLVVSRRTCSLCGQASNKLKACGSCMSTYYGGLDCQAQDWSAHRQTCCAP